MYLEMAADRAAAAVACQLPVPLSWQLFVPDRITAQTSGRMPKVCLQDSHLMCTLPTAAARSHGCCSPFVQSTWPQTALLLHCREESRFSSCYCNTDNACCKQHCLEIVPHLVLQVAGRVNLPFQLLDCLCCCLEAEHCRSKRPRSTTQLTWRVRTAC
jgi:hypothetical protein